MKDQIRIVNWLLTRKCNLKCSYCSIIKDYDSIPYEYPSMDYYYKNEMSTEYIIEFLSMLKKHNPNAFNIFYGGEPFLRKDLSKIINYCNNENIHYTIITNNSNKIQPLIKKLLRNVEYITGLTSSIDPIYNDDKNDDKVKKSLSALKMFQEYKGVIKDLVAEITVTNDNVKYLYQLVCTLSEIGISSSITFVDISKNEYYDFSNIKDESILVNRSTELKNQFDMILKDKLDIHMGKSLINKIWNILPANYNCNLENDLHNITIEADGTLRTCLRIKGVECPSMLATTLFNKDNFKRFKFLLRTDKLSYCKKCNWTCPIMSSMDNKVNDLLHSDRRN